MSIENDPSLDFNSNEDTIIPNKKVTLEEYMDGKVNDALAEEQENTATEQPDETTQKARSYGHLTKEEWEAQGRDPAQWKSPEEFVKYGNEYKEVKELIKSLKAQNNEQAERLKTLVDAQKQSALQAVQQARQQLETELRRAKEMGDIDGVERLTQAKVRNEQQLQQEETERLLRERNDVDAKFVSRNQHWFNDSRPDLKQEAQLVFKDIASNYPNITYTEAVRRMEERMRFEHPDIVVHSQPRTPISSNTSAVNKSAGEATAGDDARLWKQMTDEERAMFKVTNNSPSLKKLGLKYTVKEFLESVRKPQRG